MKTTIIAIAIAIAALFAFDFTPGKTEAQVQVAAIQQVIYQEAIQMEKDMEAALSAQGAIAAVVYE